jgi:hypothetical protein
MPLSMTQASLPALTQYLKAFSAVLDKAEAHAAARKIDPGVLLQARLYPDMFPFVKQVQIACDFAKGAAARLAGLDVPGYEDTEKTFPELKARIAKTLAFVMSVDPKLIDGSEARDITLKIAGNPLTIKGQPYLITFALPNFYFHLSVAYAILRHCGVELGKRDFMGGMPGQ